MRPGAGLFQARWAWHCAAGVAIFTHCVLLAISGTKQSPTWNELGHLAAGISNLTLNRFDLYRVNPPLARCVAALPVVVLQGATDWKQYTTDPLMRAEWQVGSDWLEANGEQGVSLLVAARWACIPFSVLGFWVCFLWARELYGGAGGLVAGLLWCFCPFILGHGCLVTADVPSAAMSVAACYMFWHWLGKPNWPRAIGCGVALGLAELTKTTLLILYPLWAVIWVVWRLPQRRHTELNLWLRDLGMLSTQVTLSLYIINLGYCFEGTFQRLGGYRFQSTTFTGRPMLGGRVHVGNRFAGTWLASLPVPLPKNYVQGIDSQKADIEGLHPSYLWGRWSQKGWRYYCLLGLLIKLPLGTLFLMVLALLIRKANYGNRNACRDDAMLLILAAGILSLVSLQAGTKASCRYVIPALPFLYIWAGCTSRLASGKTRAWAGVMIGVPLTWSMASSLGIYPHNLSYFNETVGGPANGSSYLLGGDLSWGQDLFFLKQWLKNNPAARPFRLVYNGYCKPSSLGLPFPKPPAGGINQSLKELPPGWYAVDVNCLFGDAMSPSPDAYVYFRRLRPVALVGYSIYVFRVPAGNSDLSQSCLPRMARRNRR